MQLLFPGGCCTRVKLDVLEVSKPILSVAQLHRRGWRIVFGPTCYLEKGEHRLPLVLIDGLYYLPAHVAGEMLHPSQVSTVSVLAQVPILPKWHVFEYCCQGEGRLARWFDGEG